MSVLFDAGKPRPKSSDENIRAAAIEKFLPRVLVWLNDSGETDIAASEIENIRKQLDDVLNGFNSDGYRRASELERNHHWSPDSELVEILDGWDGELYRALFTAERQWVIDYAIKPALAAGQRIKARHGTQIIEGTIKDVQTATAHYSVDVGKASEWPLVRYEDVIELEPVNPGA